MQLRLDCADRLVELVEDRRGPVRADEAARAVLRLGAPVSVALGHSLLDAAVACQLLRQEGLTSVQTVPTPAGAPAIIMGQKPA